MSTGQSPKIKGRAIGVQARLAYQGLFARQNAVNREQDSLNLDHQQLLQSVEEELEMPGALTGTYTASPTHYIDQESWNVLELPTVPPPEVSETEKPKRKPRTRKP